MYCICELLFYRLVVGNTPALTRHYRPKAKVIVQLLLVPPLVGTHLEVNTQCPHKTEVGKTKQTCLLSHPPAGETDPGQLKRESAGI